MTKVPRRKGKRLDRRTFMVSLGASAAMLSTPSLGTLAVANDGKRPNVILILTDDQGYGDMSCHGNPVLKTPNIDTLYSQSARLTDFHVDPTCSPTRAALMTGRYSSRTGVWHTFMGRSLLRKDETTMADVFSANGYKTGIFGKWHLGDNYPYRPNDRGFQESLIHGGGVVGETPDYWGNDYFDDTYFRNGKPEKFQGYSCDIWFDEAMKFIGKEKKKPFFVYLPTNTPHGPQNVPVKYRKPYEAKKTGQPRASFYGMIANIDENIGRLRKWLRKNGLEKNTILIFMTDNGTSGGVTLKPLDKNRRFDGFPTGGFGAGLRGAKVSVYDGGHRAACFVSWPGGDIGHGKDISPISAHIDMLPTLIDLCGLRGPEGVEFDGKSIASLLNGAESQWPERTLFVHNQRIENPKKWKDYAVMTDDWRLVGKELYNIKADPGQKKDVAAAHPKIVKQLTLAYEQWWKSISERFDEYCNIVVGTGLENPCRLACQSWHGAVVPYNHEHVRAGVQANGFWAIEVARRGLYEISLRRWPEEANTTINSFPSQKKRSGTEHYLAWNLYKLPNKVFKITQARLKVADFDATKPVTDGDTAIRFKVPLKEGPMRLQTWFKDADGTSRGAYFVSIRRMP